MTKRFIGWNSSGQHPPVQDTALHLVHSKKRTLGDKLQALAALSPKYLLAVETLVDYLLSTVKSA